MKYSPTRTQNLCNMKLESTRQVETSSFFPNRRGKTRNWFSRSNTQQKEKWTISFPNATIWYRFTKSTTINTLSSIPIIPQASTGRLYKFPYTGSKLKISNNKFKARREPPTLKKLASKEMKNSRLANQVEFSSSSRKFSRISSPKILFFSFPWIPRIEGKILF